MTLRAYLVAGVILALGVYAGVQTYRLNLAAKRELAARVERQRVALDAADFRRAGEATQGELAGMVLTLERELVAAQREGARIAIASTFEGHAGEIPVPIPDCEQAPPGEVAVASPAAALSPAPGGAGSPEAAGSPRTMGIDPWVHIEDGIVADQGGGIWIKRTVSARLQSGAWRSEWKEIPRENVTADETKIDGKLREAWAAYNAPKPPKFSVLPRSVGEWRAGWSCGPGGGVLITGGVGAGAFCVWGPQF